MPPQLDLDRWAEDGTPREEIVDSILYSQGDVYRDFQLKTHLHSSVCLGGTGPTPCDVMVLGRYPSDEDVHAGCSFMDPAASFFRDRSVLAGADPQDWYYTHLHKWKLPDDKYPATVTKTAKVLLERELEIVQPKFLLLLGTEPLKALFGTKATLGKVAGVVLDYQGIPTMALPHPAGVYKSPEDLPTFDALLRQFVRLSTGTTIKQVETHHQVVSNLADLSKVLRTADRDCEDQVIAVDVECHGQHPQNKGSYLRTVQLAWQPGYAATIELNLGGQATMNLDIAYELLRRFFSDKRVVGHFFAADLEWLIPVGLDLRPQFSVPQRTEDGLYPGWQALPNVGGFDTGLAAHAINETDGYKLELLALRYCGVPRYDLELQKWKENYFRDNHLDDSQLGGYGEVPREILNPYASMDADATLRLYRVLRDKLLCDDYGLDCREAFWRSMRSNLGVIEINTTGIQVDKGRLDQLTDVYLEGAAKLEQEVREWSGWYKFNGNSPHHIRELLYGEEYSQKQSGKGQRVQASVRQRPSWSKHYFGAAKSLYLEPVCDTSTPPVPWGDIRDNGTEDQHTASTDKDTLGYLLHELADGPEKMIVEKVRDLKFLRQVLKTTLRHPVKNPGTGEYLRDRDGHYVYKPWNKALPPSVCGDGRIRSYMYQTLETGRWASARPNLQNISKTREVYYKRILGDLYVYPIRSCLVASPGKILIEADYGGAELAMAAWLAGDELMIQHIADPDYDMHSHNTVEAFRLDCEPTQLALEKLGVLHYRHLCKSIVFGLLYGRSAKAISLAAKAEGIEVSVDQAQTVIDTIYRKYAKLLKLMRDCANRPKNQGWMTSPFGRHRRFPTAYTRSTEGEYSRQAKNFPEQSPVADAVNQAIDNFLVYRSRNPDLDYRVVFQIHDSILLEVDAGQVSAMIDTVIPTCMVRGVPIYPTDLNGVRTGAGPYHLSIETELYRYWGIPLDPEELI